MNERKVVRGELVVARCNPAAVLDLVEEAFDQVPSPVEIRAEADRLVAIAPWWNVGPRGAGAPPNKRLVGRPAWSSLIKAGRYSMGCITLLVLLALLQAFTQPSGTKLPLRDGVEIAQKSDDEIADPDADKALIVARYYISRGDYTSALGRLKAFLTRFRTSPHVDEALARLTDVYLKLGIASEAQNAAAVLARKFPSSRWSTYATDALRSAGLEPVEHGR